MEQLQNYVANLLVVNFKTVKAQRFFGNKPVALMQVIHFKIKIKVNFFDLITRNKF
jgi:hypothetical protein